MFSRFKEFFNIATKESGTRMESGSPLDALLSEFGGMDLGEGVYRVFNAEEAKKWKEIILEVNPEYRGKIEPFGYDWMGRCFAEYTNGEKESIVLLFDIGIGEVVSIPLDLIQFHNEEIPEYCNDCLFADYYDEWRAENEVTLGHDSCVAYKVPLFLGGEDEVNNLEVVDMEVYWGTLGQILKQI